MAPSYPNADQFISSCTGVYTFSEAISLMRIVDSLPTGVLQFRWINARTKNPVVLGYCDGSPKKENKKKIKKISPIPNNFYLKYKR